MDIRTQAALLAAIVTLALAIAALLRDNRSRVFTLFSVFSLDLFLYTLSAFLVRWPQTAFWIVVGALASSRSSTAWT